jgi:hypothetical protein
MVLNTVRDATNCPATQWLPSVLWNPKVHYCIHMNLSLVPILCQTSPTHTIPSYFSQIHFNIIHRRIPILSLPVHLILSTHLCLGLPSGLFPSGFPTNNIYAFLFAPTHATYPTHPILLLLLIRTNVRSMHALKKRSLIYSSAIV